ncbi:MAG: hypothetical protein AAGD11_02255 [Planctomycetota bacterium]
MKDSTSKQRRLRYQSLESRLVFSATPLSNGEEVRREVGQEDPYDEFYFDAQENEHVWVAVGEERAKTGNTVKLDVVSPSGRVYTDWDDNSAIESFQAPETGRYRVFVSEYGNEQDFDYVIRLLVQPEDLDRTYVQDTFLETGERFGASLGFGQLSVVQFDATAGTSVFASLGKTAGAGDPQLTIVGPDGAIEVNTWDRTAVGASFEPNVTGTYTAVIRDYDVDEGLSFTFSLASLPGEVDYSLPENTFLSSGEQHTGSIAVGEQHLIQFDAVAGGAVYASLGEVGTQAGSPQIRIVDPHGNVVSGTSTWDRDGLQVSFYAPESGLYTAVVTEYYSDATLDYTFSLASLPGPVDYQLPQNAFIGSGEQHIGSIAVGEQHLVQFQAIGGGLVYASLGEVSPQAGSPQIRIVDPNGVVVSGTSTWDRDGLQVVFEVAQSGLYTAVVTEYDSNASLDYLFSVAALPSTVDYALPHNAFIRNGEQHTGSIAVGEQHLVQFHAATGSHVVATLGELTPQNGSPQIRVIDPSGNYVSGTSTWDHDGLEIGFEASQTGLFTAVITEYDSDAPLSYQFSASAFHQQTTALPWSTSVLRDGIAQSSSLSFGEHRVHPFYVGQGDTATLTVAETSVSNAYVRLQVFSADGQRLRNSTDSSAVTTNVTASEAGYFYAVVSESGADSGLAYSVTATGLSVPAAANGTDFDGSTVVDGRDLAIWQGAFGHSSQGDADGDGDSDGSDFLSWQRSSRSPAAAVAKVIANHVPAPQQQSAEIEDSRQEYVPAPRSAAAFYGLNREVRDASETRVLAKHEDLLEVLATSLVGHRDGFRPTSRVRASGSDVVRHEAESIESIHDRVFAIDEELRVW